MRAIELIGEAPEHDGRVVVVIPNHAPQVLFNAVVYASEASGPR